MSVFLRIFTGSPVHEWISGSAPQSGLPPVGCSFGYPWRACAGAPVRKKKGKKEKIMDIIRASMNCRWHFGEHDLGRCTVGVVRAASASRRSCPALHLAGSGVNMTHSAGNFTHALTAKSFESDPAVQQNATLLFRSRRWDLCSQPCECSSYAEHIPRFVFIVFHFQHETTSS